MWSTRTFKLENYSYKSKKKYKSHFFYLLFDNVWKFHIRRREVMKQILYKLAKKYIKYYEGFSYNFNKNGEQYVLKSLSNFPIKTVFDVGANTGEWSKLAAGYFNEADFHLFELSESTFITLEKGIESKTNFRLNNQGLSNSSGIVTYQDYGTNSGLNSILQDVSYHKSDYENKEGLVTTGDEYCLKHKIEQIDILKIDVEGAENMVLEGFSQMLEKQAINIIQFEYGYTHADAHYLIKDFYKFLNGFGYKLGPLKKRGAIFMDFDYGLNDFNSGPNYIAVSDKRDDFFNVLSGPKIPHFPK